MLCMQAAVFHRKAAAVALDPADLHAGRQQIGRLVASIDSSGELQVTVQSTLCNT